MHPDQTPSRRPREPVRPGSGQESVWDYPRPPRVESTSRQVRVILGGVTIAETHRALRVLETSHPPTYYIPRADVRVDALEPVPGFGCVCEWKGAASYFHVSAGGRRVLRAAWTYPHPTPTFAALEDHVAFYPGLMDACYVDAEQVRPQPGGFYGGWVTDDEVGPFKGAPGSAAW